jgi:hypothetical protein
MLKTVDTLNDISRRCLAHEPLTHEQQCLLRGSLEKFLEHHCGSLNEAFGFRQGHGGVPWWMEQAMRRRDAALRELARFKCSGLSVLAQARFIATQSRRYAASSWRFDRQHDEMPEHYENTPHAYLWRAFKSGAVMPLSERRLRSLLAG